MNSKGFIIIFLVTVFKWSYTQEIPYILVLGVAQDGGYPHIGCEKSCCAPAWEDHSKREFVVALALVDPDNKKWYLFEATPDIREQLKLFSELTNHEYNFLPDGIFITHAHMGHYTGLMQLGREALNSKNVPVYVMEKMKSYLETNGPWSQLVQLNNINLNLLIPDSAFQLTDSVSVFPFLVPHRDEFSETAGFKIQTSVKSYLFIPDINKWTSFEKDIVELVKSVDIALLDATFYSTAELGNIDMNEVPHPFVVETMELFPEQNLREKIFFIHMNHTNPLLWDHEAKMKILLEGFFIALQGSQL